MRTLARIELSSRIGVPLLAFNSKGNLLACVGLDTNHTLVVHDWEKNITLFHTPTNQKTVLCMCYLTDSIIDGTPYTTAIIIPASRETPILENLIVTAGVRHVTFWWRRGQNVSSQRGLFGKEERDTVMSVASGSSGVCVTGSYKGTLLIWHNFKAVSNVKNQYGDMPHEVGWYPHSSPIQAMWAILGTVDVMNESNESQELIEGLSTSSRYITGDKEGLVAIWRLVLNKNWELRLKLVSLLDVNLLLPQSLSPSVRSVTERDGTLLLGTLGCEIYEVFFDNIPSLEEAFEVLKKKMSFSPHHPLSPSASELSKTASAPPLKEDISIDSVKNYNSTALSLNLTQVLPNTNDGMNSIQAINRISAHKVVSGHYLGELRGLTSHPTLPVYLTCGDDGLLCCWNLSPNRLMSCIQLPDKLKAIDIQPSDGSEVAVALNSGAVWIIKTKLLLNPRGLPMVEMDMNLNGHHVVLSKGVLDQPYQYLSPPMVKDVPDPLLDIESLTKSSNKLMNNLKAFHPKTDSNSNLDTNPEPGTLPESKLILNELPSIHNEDILRHNLDIQILEEGPMQSVKELKYSFEGSTLAVASTDRNLYLYNVKNKYQLSKKIIRGINEDDLNRDDCISHIDFGVMLVKREGGKRNF